VDRQSELIQSLRKHLEATESELANQKWVFERFLESPSWRITYPVRWAAKQARTLRKRMLDWRGASQHDNSLGREEAGAPTVPVLFPATSSGNGGGSYHLKELRASVYRNGLKNFLASGIPLRLPHREKPEISIILVLHNRAELTLQCLRSIAEHGFESLEVIVVDNASTDETVPMLKRIEGLRIIHNAENRNFLLAANQAAREAKGEYILFLNNDTQLLPGALHSAMCTIRSASNIGAVGARLILLDWTLQEAGSIIWRDGSCLGYGRGDSPFAPMYAFRRDVDYCSAAFLLTPAEIWQRLGGFDETFTPAYYEDSDYCARLWESGLRVVYDPDAVVLHYEFGSSANAINAIQIQREHQTLFASRHQSWLANRHSHGADEILQARMVNAKKRILLVEDRVPHPWLGSGFPRARSILLSLVRQGFFVTFYPMTEFDEPWTSVYSDMPNEVEFMMGYGPPLLRAFLRHRHTYYDMIFVSRPHNMKILKPVMSDHPEWFRNSTMIYDAEALFAGREISFREVNRDPLTLEQIDGLLNEELALAALADRVISVSELEKKEFEKHGIRAVDVLGHSVAPSPTPRPFHERHGLLFVGAIHEDSSPNGDSIIWFLEEIFPRIQAELGSITLTIAGVNMSERVRLLAGPSVRMTGHLLELSELYDSARVFVAPTRYSAGIPQKVHDAAARGLPVVATPSLALQLGWSDGSPIFVAGDTESFAMKCVRLHTDEELWNRLRAAGIERIRQECSPELFENRLKSIIVNGHGERALENTSR
jgi:GT2 family glycosyltransferase